MTAELHTVPLVLTAKTVILWAPGLMVMEADSEARLREWTVNWNDLIDFEIIPVRTSAEAAATIAPEL